MKNQKEKNSPEEVKEIAQIAQDNFGRINSQAVGVNLSFADSVDKNSDNNADMDAELLDGQSDDGGQRNTEYSKLLQIQSSQPKDQKTPDVLKRNELEDPQGIINENEEIDNIDG